MVVENFDFLKFCVQIFLNNKYIVLLHKIILIFSFTPSSFCVEKVERIISSPQMFFLALS